MELAGVESAVRYLGNMVVEEAKYLRDVEARVEEVHEELKWMTCFLQDVDAIRDRDAMMSEWIRQISLLAYQSEDIIESFILKVELQRRGGGIIKKLKRYSCIMREAKALHELGSDIHALKLKISTLTCRLVTYGVRTIDRGSISSVRNEDQMRRSYVHCEQGDTVGLENDVKDVVNYLTADDIKIVALCGRGGLGKTTLAEKIYHHRDIRQYFDAFAWASVSEQCHVERVATELLEGLTSVKQDEANNGLEEEGFLNTHNANNKKTLAQLMQELCEVQKKQRCLVVLDDMWNNKDWDYLKAAFPINQENSSGGKIMLTTRIEGLANYAEARIHKQLVMNEEDAWLLLGKKLRGDPSDFFGEKHLEAQELAEEMLKCCNGLPLAIVTLGGILATKKSLEEWKTTLNNIKRLLPNAKEGGLSCEKVLSLSYYDLPFHLKPCFLYLGIFPEDSDIPVTKLIQLWMAEGFLSTNISDSEDYIHVQGSSLKELGESYLAELVDRSMVQVGSTRWNGMIKTCRIHDLVRELCIFKAEEENFLKVLTGRDLGTSSSSISRMLLPLAPPQGFTSNGRQEYRRLVVHSDTYDLQKLITSIVSNPNKSNAPVHVKSLLLCGNFIRPASSILIKTVIKQYRLLRVLCLDFLGMVSLPKELGELVHLRYLSIQDSEILEVPSSIMKLKGLQTLDLRRLFKVKWWPDIIWRMRQLRHVYMPDGIVKLSSVEMIAYKIMLSEGEGGLSNHNMEVLCNFSGLHRLKDVAKLANLRKLSILQRIEKKEDLEHIKNSQSLLNGRLEHLFFKLGVELLIDEPDTLWDMKGPNKMKLEILGTTSSGSSSSSSSGCSLGPNMLPHSLTTLILYSTEIKNPDPMKILEKLPNLRKLTFGHHSYMGKEMTCLDGGFPKLVHLALCHLENLEVWTIEKGAMPSLLRLFISSCFRLKIFSDGIKSIPNLKELKIRGMGKNFCNKVREWKESAIERDSGDVKGGASGVEDGGLSDSDEVINHHIPTINMSDELDD